MGAATQIRIGFMLVSVVAIVYVTFTAYSVENGRGTTDSIRSRIEDEIQAVELPPQICEIQEDERLEQQTDNAVRQHGLSTSADDNATIISREFFEYLTSKLRNTLYPGVEIYTHHAMAQSRIKPLVGVKPLRPDFGDAINDVTGFQYPMHVPPCRESTHPAGVFVAIISAPSYFYSRETIRNTWLRDMLMMTDYKRMDLIGYAFILGRTDNKEDQEWIRKESDEFGDILQIDMKDDYYNLTLKVVGLFNWLNTNCYRANYVLKVDDDVYVNVRNLIKVMKALDPATKSTYGSIASGPPLRDGKWDISYEKWPWSQYPLYFRGAAVLFSGRTIGPLLAAAQTTPYMPFDDVYLTGLCAEKAKVSVRHNARMFVGAIERKLSPCEIYQTVTWMTDSERHLNRSHWETEKFYMNETQCIVRNKYGVNETIDRNTTVTFKFTG